MPTQTATRTTTIGDEGVPGVSRDVRVALSGSNGSQGAAAVPRVEMRSDTGR